MVFTSPIALIQSQHCVRRWVQPILDANIRAFVWRLRQLRPHSNGSCTSSTTAAALQRPCRYLNAYRTMLSLYYHGPTDPLHRIPQIAAAAAVAAGNSAAPTSNSPPLSCFALLAEPYENGLFVVVISGLGSTWHSRYRYGSIVSVCYTIQFIIASCRRSVQSSAAQTINTILRSAYNRRRIAWWG